MQNKIYKIMKKENVPNKKGILLSVAVYEKVLKVQLNLSLQESKRLSLEKTVEHLVDNYNK